MGMIQSIALVAALLIPSFAMGHDEGGRMGNHGFVVVGTGPFFIDHLADPAPHDKQLLMRVSLVDATGNKVNFDFNNGRYYLEAVSMVSLDNLASGHVKAFKANINRWNETELLFSNIDVIIEDVIFSQDIPWQQ
jgi:hypothetical protein